MSMSGPLSPLGVCLSCASRFNRFSKPHVCGLCGGCFCISCISKLDNPGQATEKHCVTCRQQREALGGLSLPAQEQIERIADAEDISSRANRSDSIAESDVTLSTFIFRDNGSRTDSLDPNNMHQGAMNQRNGLVPTVASNIVYGEQEEEEQPSGMDDVQAAVERFQLDHERERKPVLSRLAATWVPDSESRCCQLCQHAFSKSNRRYRRHHCRCCGALICDGCSEKRVLFVGRDKSFGTGDFDSFNGEGVSGMQIPGDAFNDNSHTVSCGPSFRNTKAKAKAKPKSNGASSVNREVRVCNPCYYNLEQVAETRYLARFRDHVMQAMQQTSSYVSREILRVFCLNGECLTLPIHSESTVGDVSEQVMPPNLELALFETFGDINSSATYRLLHPEERIEDLLEVWERLDEKMARIVLPLYTSPKSADWSSLSQVAEQMHNEQLSAAKTKLPPSTDGVSAGGSGRGRQVQQAHASHQTPDASLSSSGPGPESLTCGGCGEVLQARWQLCPMCAKPTRSWVNDVSTVDVQESTARLSAQVSKKALAHVRTKDAYIKGKPGPGGSMSQKLSRQQENSEVMAAVREKNVKMMKRASSLPPSYSEDVPGKGEGNVQSDD